MQQTILRYVWLTNRELFNIFPLKSVWIISWADKINKHTKKLIVLFDENKSVEDVKSNLIKRDFKFNYNN